MTFHRFLTGRRLTISVDGVPVAKWDPFLEGNSARQVLGTELLTYSGGVVEVDPYVLPHRSKLSDEDFKVGGGKRGWNDLQGFFVYRNQRLLVAGDWLGLRFTKEEHYKLARIRVDLPNDADELWQIDVRKSVAVPPAEIRGELTRIAKVTRERAVEVYRYRGKVLSRRASQGVIPLWQERVRHGRVSYAINTDHEAVASALREPTSKSVRTLLKLIEETIPVPLIAINSSEKPTLHSTPLEDLTPRIVSDLATEIYRSFRASGLSHREAVGRVMSTDPFHLHPELHEVLNALAGTKKETA
jgi:hypothetical protein